MQPLHSLQLKPATIQTHFGRLAHLPDRRIAGIAFAHFIASLSETSHLDKGCRLLQSSEIDFD